MIKLGDSFDPTSAQNFAISMKLTPLDSQLTDNSASKSVSSSNILISSSSEE
jgi:hypothetical protein